MKRALVALGVVLAVVVVVFVAGGTLLVREGETKFQATQQQLAAEWARWATEIEADEARWRDDPLIAPADGGDASSLLFAHVRWDRLDAGLASPEVPAALVKQFKEWGADWPTHAGEAGVELLDFKWMADLPSYGYWDLEPLGGALDAVPFSPLTEPIPQFVDLLDIARARLSQGLASGHPVEAAMEVRALARLALSSEQLVGMMVGVGLLHVEHRAWEEAMTRGLDVTGWEPISEADQQRLKRIVWAANAPVSLAGNGPMIDARVNVGRCSALREGLGGAHFLRGYLQRRFAKRYEALTHALEESPCRLRRQRAVWNHPGAAGELPVSTAAFCTGAYGDSSGAFCGAPDFVVAFPFVRDFVGLNLVSIGGPDWFKPYRSP